MRHDERHAALAAYAFWCKLEQTGTDKYEMLSYYEQLFNHINSSSMCPACEVAIRRAKGIGANMCKNCPCEWGTSCCLYECSVYCIWQDAPLLARSKKKAAGDIANIMRKWCERVGVIAPREG